MCYSVAPILACRWTVFSWLYFPVWSFPTSTQLRCILGRHVIEASFYTLCCCRFKVFSCQHISYNTWSSLNSCFYLGVWRLISGVVSLNGKDLWKWTLILILFQWESTAESRKASSNLLRCSYQVFMIRSVNFCVVSFMKREAKKKENLLWTLTEWMNDWMNEWMGEWMNEWMLHLTWRYA